MKKELNPRYASIIKSGRKLFWKHGFKRVTVEEICKTAGVSKMTFYRYFRNKIELAKTVYEKEAREGFEKFRSIMSDENSTPLEKMEQILTLKLEGTNEISYEFLKDFYHNKEAGLPEFVEDKSRQLWDAMMEDFKKAQQKGWIRRDFKPEGVFLFINKLYEIVNDDEAVRLYGSPQEAVMELARFFTFGIMPRESGKPGNK